MKEILVSGNVDKDFKRLGVNAKLTYGNEDTDYKVYEVTEEDFDILCNEPNTDNTWINCGWRYCEGSNMGYPNVYLNINEKRIKCWMYEFEDEPIELYDYETLIEYINEECGATTFKNICAIAIDLAKYNKMKMSELFKVYEGE